MNIELLGDGTLQPFHDIRLIIDLFLGGLGVGAFIISILFGYMDRERYAAVVKTGAYIAPVAVSIGLILLATELAQPGRFLSTFFNTSSTSAMSWGVFAQSLFVLVSVIYALAVSRIVSLGSGGMAVIGAIGLVLAIAVGFYHGLWLSVVAARPLWNVGVVPALFFGTAITSGLAAVILLSGLIARDEDTEGTIAPLSRALVWGLVVVLALVGIDLWVLSSSSIDAQDALSSLVTGEFAIIFWVGAVLLGLLIPLGIGLFSGYAAGSERGEVSLAVPMTLSLLVLIGVFALRYAIVWAGQGQPLLPL